MRRRDVRVSPGNNGEVAYYYVLRGATGTVYLRSPVGEDSWMSLEYHMADRELAHHTAVAAYQVWQAMARGLEVSWGQVQCGV